MTARNRYEERKRNPVAIPTESPTQQHMAGESDINHIVAKYRRTGVLGSPQDIARRVVYGDFSAFDYQDALNMVTNIRSQFMTLPAKVRRRFNHDPHTMIAFVENPANRQEALKLGLLEMTEEELVAADKAADELAEKARQRAAQLDLVDESNKAPKEAPKADKEAQPTFK